MLGEDEMHQMARILRANFTQQNLDVLHYFGYTTEQVQEFMDFISQEGTFKEPDFIFLQWQMPARLFRNEYIVSDGDSLYIADNRNRYDEAGNRTPDGDFVKREQVRYLGKFTPGAWKLLTDSNDMYYLRHTREELIKDGFSPDDIDFVTDVCRRKLGFMAFTTGKLPYRDFPLRAVDWMMIPAVKINEIEELKNVVEPKDILNTSLYTQLFYVNWAQGHFHENKWDANELDEVIPNFKKAVKLVENRPRPKMWLTYDKARKNLRRVMKENAKVPDRNISK